MRKDLLKRTKDLEVACEDLERERGCHSELVDDIQNDFKEAEASVVEARRDNQRKEREIMEVRVVTFLSFRCSEADRSCLPE